ncbi:hypothetical protein [Candidatus Magnetominusculus xianensis]|nr:hypothetical protein [Candidatus Magnetominusculus xianensis]MBF0403628.1 hypothetical protein [Nitrospirota bacterium]
MLKASKALSVMGAAGYLLLPQLEHSVFYHGIFENIAYGILPYVFASLFARKWGWFYFTVLMFSLISLPYSIMAMMIGIVTAIFYRAKINGTIAFMIGFVVTLCDKIVWKQSLCGMTLSTVANVNIINDFVIKQIQGWVNNGQAVDTLLWRQFDQLEYVSIMFLTVAFLPIYGLRRQGRWNYYIIGLVLLALINAFVNSFRLSGWDVHRTAAWVVPIYLSAFVACINTETDKDNTIAVSSRINISKIFLFACIISMTLLTTLRYPWLGLNNYFKRDNLTKVANYPTNIRQVLKPLEMTKEKHLILSDIKRMVPDNASVAYFDDIFLANYIANRQHAWQMDYRYPDSVEYYIFTVPDFNTRLAIIHDIEFKEKISMILSDKMKDVTLLYKDNALQIYKNNKPTRIPRLEDTLGWSAVIPFKSCNK